MKINYIFFTLAALAFFSTAQAQVKIGANPSAIGTNSALEVEATNGKKVVVNKTTGQMTIQNTPVGAVADSILTKDANGNIRAIGSTATTPTNIYVLTTLNAFITVQGFTTGVTTYPTYFKVPYDNEINDNRNAYNNNVFTAPEPGFYQVNQVISLNYDGTAAGTSYAFSAVDVTGPNAGKYYASALGYDTGVLGSEGSSASLSVTVYLNAGDTITPQYALVSQGATTPNQISLRGASPLGRGTYLSIAKL